MVVPCFWFENEFRGPERFCCPTGQNRKDKGEEDIPGRRRHRVHVAHGSASKLPVFDDVENLSLFGPEETSSGFDRNRLAQTLASLAANGILIGTSSWKYEGWLGQIYTPDRYSFRG